MINHSGKTYYPDSNGWDIKCDMVSGLVLLSIILKPPVTQENSHE